MMTNYPAEYGTPWQEMTFREWLTQLKWAIEMADWDPRSWALCHDVCFDLPSAWWAAGHALEFAREISVCGGLHEYLTSSYELPEYLRGDLSIDDFDSVDGTWHVIVAGDDE